jgi:hypothetical protein
MQIAEAKKIYWNPKFNNLSPSGMNNNIMVNSLIDYLNHMGDIESTLIITFAKYVVILLY